MQLWAKEIGVNERIEKFTTGMDRELDTKLALYDALGSIAHITMLETIGLITKEELPILKKSLIEIIKEIKHGDFVIENGVEDVHSQIEFILTHKLGEAGKKIHSGRSRNDQVLLDLKLYMRDELEMVVMDMVKLFELLQSLSERHKDVLLPGYTHFQVAMPSSFGLWFGAYAESLVDDLTMLYGAYKVVNKNPLGSAAGYGSSFPLNRTLTTQLLGFDDLNYNVVYAQMTRGKTDFVVASALASVAYTLNKMAADVVLYVSQNFNFISFPDELMEGSSIMPHKKNPDVFELVRAKTNKIKALPNTINLITTNMPSGYHRDWQILKEFIIPAFDELKECIQMVVVMLAQVKIREGITKEEKYKYLFSVERVNELVLLGTPFRDAYKQVGKEIESGAFEGNVKIRHSHEGSIGKLCNDEIKTAFDEVYGMFGFGKKSEVMERLLEVR